MSLFRFAVVGSLAVSLSACINSSTLVKVKPDGSGTIEQTLLVNTQALKGLMGGLGGGQMKETGSSGPNEADFKRAADRMGVRLVSSTPLKENGFEGSKAIFAFDDITKVRVDQDPQMGGTMGAGGGAPKESPIHFSFASSSKRPAISISSSVTREPLT